MNSADFAQLCNESLPAAYEVARQLGRGRTKAHMSSSEAVYKHSQRHFLGEAREVFLLLILDGKHRLLRDYPISIGSATSTLVHPREVMKEVVTTPGAVAFALAHNHPSGDPEPSAEDIEVTRRLLRCGRLFGIPLLDHVVCGATEWVSLRKRIAFENHPYLQDNDED